MSGNTGLNGKDGVSFVNSHFITIQGHELVGSNTGIDMKFGAADNIILDNTLTDVKLFGLSLSDNNKVLDNTITGSGRFGILIFGGSKNVIEGNTMLDNGYSRQEPIFAGIAVGAGSWRALGVNCSVKEIGEPFNCDEDAEWNPFHQASSFDNIVRGNRIANNNGPGILVGGVFNEWVPGIDASEWDPDVKAFIGETVYVAQRNSFLNNMIYGNVGLGIDLSDESQFLYFKQAEPIHEYYSEVQTAKPDGVTANDSVLLANDGQNYPLLRWAKVGLGRLIVRGTIDRRILDPLQLSSLPIIRVIRRDTAKAQFILDR